MDSQKQVEKPEGNFLLLKVFVCLVLLWCGFPAFASEAHPPKKILLLYSYQSVLPAILEWDEGIRSGLQGIDPGPLEFYTEYLDLARFPGESYVKNLITLLQNKYSGKKIDLLIPVGDLAFQFLSSHGNSLFPGVPMVFCAAVKTEIQTLAKPKNSTGVVAWIDVEGTLEAALKMQPQTRQVVVVGGSAKTDRLFQQLAREALRHYEGRLEATFLTDLPASEIFKRLGNLPPQAIVLFLSLLRDSEGKEFIPRDAAALVSQTAKVPVYGLWETLLGYGIVGGHLMSFRAQGRIAGEIGRRVLQGEKPDDIPIVVEGANFYLFDWRQLKRWGLSEAALPPGSVVRFKDLSVWELYRWHIIGLIALVFIQGLMIGLLTINRRKHRQAEQNYRTVANFTYDWEYWANPDGTLKYVSPSCERISGYRAEEFLERPDLLREIVVSEDQTLWNCHHQDEHQGMQAGELRFRIGRKDGGIRWIEHTCQPVTGSQGEFLGIRVSNRDITDRLQAELEAQRHREELAHLSRVGMLGELTASLAHELNQPLTAILSNAQAGQRFLQGTAPDPAEVAEILKDIAQDSKRAGDMVHHLRRHLRRGEFERKPVSLNDVVQGVVVLVHTEAAASNVKLVYALPDDLPLVLGDRIQLEQVVLNLILNGLEAVRNIPTGSRNLEIKTERQDAATLLVSILDSGSEIKPEEAEKIFEPFFTTKPEGLGLGLSLSRAIIEAHGGKLWATPLPHRGTALHFTLPVFQEEGP